METNPAIVNSIGLDTSYSLPGIPAQSVTCHVKVGCVSHMSTGSMPELHHFGNCLLLVLCSRLYKALFVDLFLCAQNHIKEAPIGRPQAHILHTLV